jgi:hypothetical protein
VYGSVDDPRLTYCGNVKLWPGSNTISCLSIAVGLPVSAPVFSTADSTLGFELCQPFQIHSINLRCRMWENILRLGMLEF